MPLEIYNFAVSTPAGTALTAPQTTALTMPARIVRRITVKVPPGPAGHLAFQIAVNGVSQIPINGAQWIITDNEEISWDFVTPVESGAWQCKSYNTGIYAHTIYIRFEVDLPVPKERQIARAPLAL